jgi:hypothetical protein
MISRMKLGTVLICLFRYEFSNQTNSHKKSHCVNIEISAYDKSYEKSYEKADSVNFTLDLTSSILPRPSSRRKRPFHAQKTLSSRT